MIEMTKGQWLAVPKDRRGWVAGRHYVLVLDKVTGATVWEPVFILDREYEMPAINSAITPPLPNNAEP